MEGQEMEDNCENGKNGSPHVSPECDKTEGGPGKGSKLETKELFANLRRVDCHFSSTQG